MTQSIEYRKDGPLAEIRFNRPEAYNALSPEMAEGLLDALIDVHEDAAVRAVLLTGNGKAFHAGGDVKAFVQAGDDVPRFIDRLVSPFHAVISHMVRLPKPIVAAVNGVAAGAGFSLAMACDLVYAHPEAVFTVAYSKIGTSPDGGMSHFLVRLVGVRRAMELYATNRVLSAREAVDWGLVTDVVDAADFVSAVRGHAMALAEGPTQAYGRAKELFHFSFDHSLETQLEREARRIVASSRTADFREGTRAFAEKRPARFQGR